MRMMRTIMPLFFAILYVAAILVFVWRHGSIEYSTLLFVAMSMLSGAIRWRFTRGQPLQTVSERVTTQEKLLLFIALLGMVLLPLTALLTPFIDFALYQTSLIAFIVGGAAMVGGLYVFYRSHADLGQFWSPTLEIRDGHQLVDTGIYKYVRHPMYLAIFLQCIGQLLLFENWLAGAAGIISFSVLYFLRIEKEEQLLIEHFGDSYRRYAAKTPRILPFF